MNDERKISLLMSFVAGFVDTAGFIALSGLFTAHVTGNLVLAGASIVQADSRNVVSRLLLIPVFMVVVGIVSILISALKAKCKPVLRILLFWEAFFLLGFSLLAYYYARFPLFASSNAKFIYTGILGVTALAIQNALLRSQLPGYVPNTVMTGNLTQFSTDLSDFLLKRFSKSFIDPLKDQELRIKLLRFGNVLVGFLVGAAFGALTVQKAGLICCIIPAMLIFFLAFTTRK